MSWKMIHQQGLCGGGGGGRGSRHADGAAGTRACTHQMAAMGATAAAGADTAPANNWQAAVRAGAHLRRR